MAIYMSETSTAGLTLWRSK